MAIDLNVGELLGGSGHRQYGYGGAYRPTGIFDEPGIYGVFIFSLFIVKYMIVKQNEGIDYVVFVSILMTNSIYSTLLIMLFCVWKIQFELKMKLSLRGRIALNGIAISFIALSIILFIPRFYAAFDGEDYSTLTKLILIDEYFNNDDMLFLSGVGLLPLDYWRNVGYQAMGDMTFFVSTLVIYGIPIGCGLIIGVLVLVSGGAFNKWTVLALLPLIKLTMLSWTFFWVYILLVRVALDKNKKEPMYDQKTMV